MWSRKLLAVSVAGVLTAAACTETTETTETQNTTTAPKTTVPATSSTEAPPPPPPPVDPRTQAASLLMPGVTSFDDALAKLNAGVSGIFLTSWADPRLLTEPGRDLHALRDAAGRDFDVAIDFEGGRVQRFSQILGSYPSASELGVLPPEQIERRAFELGSTLKSHGITVDFAPVLDVDGGGLEVVGDRAFSADPVQAGESGAAFARGLEKAGVDAVFKHYPGHGRASGDTHAGLAYTPPLDEFFGRELVPYDVALPQDTGADVMVGHMVVPGLGEPVPASLNNHAYGLLRNHHHFTGLAYTDDLTGMRAITDTMSPEQAIPQAIIAGADRALWSSAADVNAVIDAVATTVPPEILYRTR